MACWRWERLACARHWLQPHLEWADARAPLPIDYWGLQGLTHGVPVNLRLSSRSTRGDSRLRRWPEPRQGPGFPAPAAGWPHAVYRKEEPERLRWGGSLLEFPVVFNVLKQAEEAAHKHGTHHIPQQLQRNPLGGDERDDSRRRAQPAEIERNQLRKATCMFLQPQLKDRGYAAQAGRNQQEGSESTDQDFCTHGITCSSKVWQLPSGPGLRALQVLPKRHRRKQKDRQP